MTAEREAARLEANTTAQPVERREQGAGGGSDGGALAVRVDAELARLDAEAKRRAKARTALRPLARAQAFDDLKKLEKQLAKVRKSLPPEVLARQVDDGQAVRELILKAAGALGVGTEADLRDYFRLGAAQVKPALAALVAAGELERVTIDGVPAYLLAGQKIPRADRGTALLCPFDPLIFFRPRVERLFGFHYRIEIYTPAAKRQYGYYVWPFLLDGELVGRVDLKADRAAGVLHVPGAFTEGGRDRRRIAAALAAELASMAEWLGLQGVRVGDRGDLAGALAACC